MNGGATVPALILGLCGPRSGCAERDALAAQRTAPRSDVFQRFVRDEKSRIGEDWIEEVHPAHRP